MSNRVLLPQALRAVREAKAATDPKFRVGAFAASCLISSGHLSNIEAGRKRPPPEVIHRLALNLGVSVDALSYVENVSSEAIA